MLQVTAPAFSPAPAWVPAAARSPLHPLFCRRPDTRTRCLSPSATCGTGVCTPFVARDPRLGLLAAHPGLRRIPCLPQRPRHRVAPRGPSQCLLSGRCHPERPAEDSLAAPSGGSFALWKKKNLRFKLQRGSQGGHGLARYGSPLGHGASIPMPLGQDAVALPCLLPQVLYAKRRGAGFTKNLFW